jgi:enterochelin esterase-like enzyme
MRVSWGLLPFFLWSVSVRCQTKAIDDAPIQSRRLFELEERIQNGDSTAEAAFWRGLVGQVPFWERIPPNNQGYSLVTFVWRGDDTTIAVTLDAPLPIPPNRHFDDQGPLPLTRLAGTHVWYRTERLPFDYRLLYTFHVTHRGKNGIAHSDEALDPLNSGPSVEGGSVAEGVFAPKQRWLVRLPGVAAGSLRPDSLFSQALGDERTFTVYSPPVSSQRRTALVVLFDGERYTQDVPIPPTLDNLIAKDMIERTVVVFVNTRRWNRQDDISCNLRFEDFIVRELVPFIVQAYRLTITPAHTVIGGSSLGGLQAACTAFHHPTVFGSVLSLSGSFAWYPGEPSIEPDYLTDHGWLETGWLTRAVAAAPRRLLRFYLATGIWEGDGLYENRRMRDVLSAKGYPLVYQEYSGGHDEVVWRGLIADGLIALIPSAEQRKATHSLPR